MFTGLIQHVGEVASFEMIAGGARLTVDAATWAHRPRFGESIAVDGCCLTIAEQADDGRLCFDLVAQTLAASNLGLLQPGARVNLEHAVTPSTLLGGHIVQGHVDGVGTVGQAADVPGERRVRIAVPEHLAEVIVEKGSIAVNGVSLTVASVGEGWFEVALIPTTLKETTLGQAKVGTRVNLEGDYIAKTVVHWLKRRQRD